MVASLRWLGRSFFAGESRTESDGETADIGAQPVNQAVVGRGETGTGLPPRWSRPCLTDGSSAAYLSQSERIHAPSRPALGTFEVRPRNRML